MHLGIRPWEMQDFTPGELDAIDRVFREMEEARKNAERKAKSGRRK